MHFSVLGITLLLLAGARAASIDKRIIPADNATYASEIGRISRPQTVPDIEKIDYEGCGQRVGVANNGQNELHDWSRIVGGAQSVPHSWPFICSLRSRNSQSFHFCGINLIRNRRGDWYAITAAHCVDGSGYNGGRRYVAICGIHDRTARGILVEFDYLWTHENYDSWSLDNDFALFRVSSNVPENDPRISHVCLPNEGWNDGQMSIVAGWGTQRHGDNTSPRELYQVNKPIKPRAVCESRYGKDKILPSMMCAGLTEGGKDACQGDSGGPLYTLREEGKEWHLTGVVSWGYGCAEALRPGVYADVLHFKNWIHKKINA